MNNNKGITIITLIITIIVIVIISVFTINKGLNENLSNADQYKTLNNVSLLIDAVENRKALHKLNPSNYGYIGDNEFDSKVIGSNTYRSSDGWYNIQSNDELQELGVENISGTYLVNYNTGKVVSVEGIQYNGVDYYILNDLKQAILDETNPNDGD